MFGAAYCSLTGGAPVYSFLQSYLHTDDFSFGLVMAAGPTALLFFFFGSLVVERSRAGQSRIFCSSSPRAAWRGSAWPPWRCGCRSHPHATGSLPVLLVGLALFASAAMQNYGGAGWPMWMSEVVPTAVAGKFFGFRNQIGLISMVLAALAGSAIIDHYQKSGWTWLCSPRFSCVAAVFGAWISCTSSPSANSRARGRHAADGARYPHHAMEQRASSAGMRCIPPWPGSPT